MRVHKRNKYNKITIKTKLHTVSQRALSVLWLSCMHHWLSLFTSSHSKNSEELATHSQRWVDSIKFWTDIGSLSINYRFVLDFTEIAAIWNYSQIKSSAVKNCVKSSTFWALSNLGEKGVKCLSEFIKLDPRPKAWQNLGAFGQNLDIRSPK